MAHKRRHLSGFGDSTRDYGTLLVAALRGGWWTGLGSAALFGVLWVDVTLLAGGAVPGGGGLLVALALLAGLVSAVLMRAASTWSDREGPVADMSASGWWELVKRGARASASDPTGTVLLLMALFLSLLLIWMFTPLGILMPGLWVLAAVGVDYRQVARPARRP